MTQAPVPPPARKRVARRSSGGAGQWMLGAVIALAVVGTGLWVFSDDRRWGLIALILLVWGLVIAAFLIARYARDLRAAESKESGLKTVYELQLEREISARREYELQVERDIRAELSGESNEELTALKAEVLALRANLEELLGRDLGPSYSELYAAAEQRAIAAQQAKSVFEDDDRFRAQQDFAGVPDHSAVDDYYGAEPVSAAEPVEVPLHQDPPTAVFHVIEDPIPAAPQPPEPAPVDVEHVEHIDPTSGEPFVPLAPQSGYVQPPQPSVPQPPQQAFVPQQPVPPYSPFQANPPQAPAPEGQHPDHVAGQHSSGSTVADLIARMNGGTGPATGGRRRKPE